MSLPTITIYTPAESPRLQYVLDWLLREQLGFTYRLVHDPQEAAASKHCISMGFSADLLSMHHSGILFEEGIAPQNFQGTDWNGLHTYFFQEASPCTIPFDLFGGIFYFLTRYEEYTETAKDKHNRYPSYKSILSQEGVLERPVLDEWVNWFRLFLENEWQLTIPTKPFEFAPTYDIDIAWSYKHKGAKRLLGASLKELAKGNFSAIRSRINVLAGTAKDPYDAYEWMDVLHKKYQLTPHYFILAALQSTPFDKNIHPLHPAMQQLVISLKNEGRIGMHPSYFTNNSTEKFTEEKQTLEQLTGYLVNTSRQHYIRVFIPETYRALMAAGIENDYSMGYGTALGFRAGTSRSFYWYDLEREQVTALRVHPFCFMDTTAHYDLGLNVSAAFERLRQMRDLLIKCNGKLTTVFHNFSLGLDLEWQGWPEAYDHFIKAISPE